MDLFSTSLSYSKPKRWTQLIFFIILYIHISFVINRHRTINKIVQEKCITDVLRSVGSHKFTNLLKLKIL